MSPAISIRGLRVVRGGREVLHEIDLEVEAGRVTGLLGPSGSGKTTLIRSIVGVQIVAGGTVSVLGLPAGAAPLRQRVGYMTQAPSVYGDLTVRENLTYFGRIVGVERDRVDEVVERVGLTAETDQVVAALSGGQRARVSLGTALLSEPELTLDYLLALLGVAFSIKIPAKCHFVVASNARRHYLHLQRDRHRIGTNRLVDEIAFGHALRSHSLAPRPPSVGSSSAARL